MALLLGKSRNGRGVIATWASRCCRNLAQQFEDYRRKFSLKIENISVGGNAQYKSNFTAAFFLHGIYYQTFHLFPQQAEDFLTMPSVVPYLCHFDN